MSAFLARVGHANTRQLATSLWKSTRRKRLSWVGEDIRRAAGQHRSYGDDDGVRWTAGGLTFSGEEEAKERKQTQSKTSRDRVKSSEYSPFVEHETTGDAFFTQRSPEDEQLDLRRGREDDEHDDFWERVERPIDEDERSESQTTSRVTSQEGEQDDLWEQFEKIEDEDDESAPALVDLSRSDEVSESADAPVDKSLFDEASLLDIDYKANLHVALGNQDADMLARCLFAAERDNDFDFLNAIPQRAFSEIIQVLDPTNFIAKLASTQVELSASIANYIGVAPMRQIAYEYSIVLRRIIELRQSGSIKLTLDDFTLLLKNARDLGSRRMSVAVWTLMINEGHIPTTTCYNYLMSTLVWNGAHSAGSRQNLRVTPYNMSSRKQQLPRYRNYQIGAGGVQENVMRNFNEMLSIKAIADELSFRTVITACAREGNIDVVKSVLKKVWGVDVDGIIEGRDESEMMPKQIPETSPLRPTVGLLWTVAHAFGINNDVPAALRTVDFVARHYDLTVSDEAWAQLFEWTFVLAIRRSPASKQDGNAIGALPQQSVMNLWDTMVGAPYYIQPTIGMYNKLIKSLRNRGYAPQIADKMRDGLRLHQQHFLQSEKAAQKFFTAVEHQKDYGPAGDNSIESLRNEFEYRELIIRRNLFFLRRWARLYLASFNQWHKVDHGHQGLITELPAMVWEWRRWMPNNVHYETMTGFVELQLRTDEERAETRRRFEEKKEERTRVVDAAKKLIGHNWIRGREPVEWQSSRMKKLQKAEEKSREKRRLMKEEREIYARAREGNVRERYARHAE